jgi:2'-5' RNA ligase
VPGTLRAFVAARLPGALLTALEDLQGELRAEGLRARWVRPGGMHLTLAFLGEIPAGQVAAVAGAVRCAAAGCAPVGLSAGGIGVFPGLRRPRVLWVGLAGQTERLAELQRRLDGRLSALGFQTADRPFRGHVTLGRLTSPVDAGRIAAAVASRDGRLFGRFEVRELVLIQSDLRPSGPVYTELIRAALAEGG